MIFLRKWHTSEDALMAKLDAIEKKLEQLVDSIQEAMEDEDLTEGTIKAVRQKNLDLITTLFAVNCAMMCYNAEMKV